LNANIRHDKRADQRHQNQQIEHARNPGYAEIRQQPQAAAMTGKGYGKGGLH
jgi:hypothetical protein